MSAYILTPISAQMIVDTIMQNTPNNINIMDDKGMIIASGKKDRIGSFHKGAIKAIEEKRQIFVYENTLTEKKGINLPIMHMGNVVGVIGISGEIDQVLPLGQMARSLAQLIIQNQIYMEMSVIKENRFQNFLFEWSSMNPDEYTSNLVSQAKLFNVDLRLRRVAVIITVKRTHYSIVDEIKRRMDEGEYIYRQGMNQITILMKYDAQTKKRLNNFIEMNKDIDKCFIGEPGENIKKSNITALQTMDVVQRFDLDKKIVSYSDVELESILMHSDTMTENTSRVVEVLKSCEMKNEFIKTIFTYIEYSDNLNRICEELHIHRNTLNYRIQKLLDITGWNLKNSHDAMMLYKAVIYIMRDEWNLKNR